ncbi:hypothetical protein HAX54_043251 [Datura stramonium]|uniref:Uncharacterized protein n=1 Tax=Datura stramonium TaxID=4076 RepID=A0ABS8SP94_DATST|nr:hypothetical protein [Datura stramonium]
MLSAKKLVKMARKWQKFAAIQRKRISLPRNGNDADSCSTSSSFVAGNGQFVVYTTDQRRFEIPLAYLDNELILHLLNMSEEEFELPSRGPITLPCDSAFMNYILSLIKKAEKGQFVVYTTDQRRFVIPLAYLENELMLQLLNMSEEEFGLPCGGPITVSCDSAFMDYIVSLIKKGATAEDLHKALLLLISSSCSSTSSSHQDWGNQLLLVY